MVPEICLGPPAAAVPSGNGTVFRLSPKGALTVLYSFAGGADGKGPLAAPLIGSDGTLFGTTYEGGAAAGCGNSFGCGIVFSLSSAGKEKVLYAFCKLKNCADGAAPQRPRWRIAKATSTGRRSSAEMTV